MLVNNRYTLIALTVAMFGSFATARPVSAVGSSGFENASLSTRSLAKSNAVVADPEECDTVSFNPAGLTKLEGTRFYAGTSLITAAYHYEPTNNRLNEDNSETVIPVPFMYASTSTPIDGLKLGIGMNSPFGLVSKWSSIGHFRYTGYYNELKTAAYTTSLAYEVAPWLSVGGGWTYMDVGIKQVGKFNTNFIAGAPAGTFGDSPFELDVEGQGQGWNLGVLLTPNETHSIGVFYRSQVHAELKGYLSSDNLGPLTATFGGGTNITSTDTDYTFPHNLTVGYKYSPNDALDLELDLGWTGWSSFDQTEILFGTSNAVLNGFRQFSHDFKDVLSINTGVGYKINSDWKISAGYYFYDMAANENNFDNSIPDGDRHGVSFGMKFSPQPNWSLDLMYIAQWVREVEIDTAAGIGNGANIDGNYSGLVQILTTGISYQF